MSSQSWMDGETSVNGQLEKTLAAIQPHIDQYLGGLPPFLQCSSLSLIHQSVNHALSVTVSPRIEEETKSLAFNGLKYCTSRRFNTSLCGEFHKLLRRRSESNTGLQSRAHRIQSKWYNSRFRTMTLLPALELSEFVFREISTADIVKPSTPFNPHQLEIEIAKYSVELENRISASREAQRRQAKADSEKQHTSLARRRLQAHAKQKKYDQVQQRWEYLAQQFIRRHRFHRMSRVIAAHKRQEFGHDADDINGETTTRRRENTNKPAEYIVLYVNSILNQALRRAAWTIGIESTNFPPPPTSPCPGTTSHKEAIVLRVAMLCCPNPFDAHFGLLYQRYFAKYASTHGVIFEWMSFDVVTLDFPTQATQRCIDGFLVCGAPDVVHSMAAHARVASTWYHAFIEFLRVLISQGRIVGGLGRGHIILAEALGGHIVKRPSWHRVQNVVEEKIIGKKQTQTKVSVIPTLHGEYVVSLTNPMVKVIPSVPLPGSMYSYISSFYSRHIYSFDGYPECGSLVFSLLAQMLQKDHSTFSSKSLSESALSLTWVSAAPSVAARFIQLFLPAAITRINMKGKEQGQIKNKFLQLHHQRELCPKLLAMKSSIPLADFISDTNEYFNFAVNEKVDAIVLGVILSRDHHPIVFPRTILDEMTDVREVFPTLYYSPVVNYQGPIAGGSDVSIQRLTLHEIKSLTILHSYQRRHVMKSPRLVAGSSSNTQNRLQTLLASLFSLYQLQATAVHTFEIVITFPTEETKAFTHHSIDDIHTWWLVINAALLAVQENNEQLNNYQPIRLTIASRDSTILQIFRKVQPGWTYIYVMPLETNPQGAYTVRKQAKFIAHFADGVLVHKEHELIALESLNHDTHVVNVVDVFHEVGLQFYVNTNAPDSSFTPLLGTSNGPVREHIAFIMLGVDGIFTSNPHPVQDAWKLYQEQHTVTREVDESIESHCQTLVAQKDTNQPTEPSHHEDDTRRYSHHYYNLPLGNHEFDQWRRHVKDITTPQALIPSDWMLAQVDRLLGTNIRPEISRQLQGHFYQQHSPPCEIQIKRNEMRMSVKTPTLDSIRFFKRQLPPRGKRNRSIGTFVNTTPPVQFQGDPSSIISIQHMPMPLPKRTQNPRQQQRQRMIKPSSQSNEIRQPSIIHDESTSIKKKNMMKRNSINLPICKI